MLKPVFIDHNKIKKSEKRGLDIETIKEIISLLLA
jgi:hypothetical protein